MVSKSARVFTGLNPGTLCVYLKTLSVLMVRNHNVEQTLTGYE